MPRRNRALHLLWQLPLACFILAGLTGFLYRLGLTGADPLGLSLQNIRHAHSHLMFFCWAVPLPMYFIICKVYRDTKETGPPVLMTRMALAGLFLGLLSFPFFLGWGYRPVTIGTLELPLSVILSGLVMCCWYGFIVGYWKERKALPGDRAATFYDGALLMLFISSLGAWGVAVVQFSGIDNPLIGKSLTHFFLAVFTEGYIVMALLGVLYQQLGTARLNTSVPGWLFSGLILFGAPLTFPYGISAGLMTDELMLAARIGGGLAAVGLGLNLHVMGRGLQHRLGWAGTLIGILLTLKASGQFAASVLPSAFWLSDHGLRILYLHLLLLGGFSFTMFTVLAEQQKTKNGLKAVAAAIVLMVLSLTALTPLWPASWFPINVYYWLTVLSVLPTAAAAWLWLQLSRGSKQAGHE